MTKCEKRRRYLMGLAWRNYRRHCEKAVRALEADDLLTVCRHRRKADWWYLRHDSFFRRVPLR